MRPGIKGQVTVSAAASDNAGINKVEFYVDGVLRGIAADLARAGSGVAMIRRLLVALLALWGSFAAAADPTGSLGGNCTAAWGWTCDPDLYSQSLKVHFYKDGAADGGGVYLDQVAADGMWDSNVGPFCWGWPNHSFWFPIPDSLKDGKTHTLYAHAINIDASGTPSGWPNPLLAGSPVSLTCQPEITALQATPSFNVTAKLGGSFTLTYNWQAAAPTAKSWKVYSHFLGAGSQIVFSDEHTPPTDTTAWSGTVSYTRTIMVPSNIAAATYRIHVGLYNVDASGNFEFLTLNPGVGAVLDKAADSTGIGVQVGLLTVQDSAGKSDQFVKFGVQDVPDIPSWEGGRYSSEHLQKLQELNVQVQRIGVQWHLIELVKGQRTWTNLDGQVNEIVAAGMEPLATICCSPGWANGTDGSTWYKVSYVPTEETAFSNWLSDYKIFVRDMVLRYKDRVKLWELWNEPNWRDWWAPQPNMDHYARWFSAVEKEIKAADPGAKVALGALTVLDGWSEMLPGDIKGTDFLRGMYERGVFPDIVSLHPYPQNNEAPDTYTSGVSTFRSIETIKQLMDSWGQSNTKVWITEFGWGVGGTTFVGGNSSSGVSITEDVQAQYLRRSMEIIRDKYPYVTRVMWYLAGPPKYIQDGFSPSYVLLRDDGTLTPAGAAYRDFVQTVSGSLPVGYHDSSSCTSSFGWACDADDFGKAIEVQLYDGPAESTGVYLGKVTADQSREAGVSSLCGGYANHGFSFSTPASIKDGKSHSLYAYAVNYGPDRPQRLLTSSPISITCADTVAPTASITAPTANARISGKASVAAKASDNIAVTKLELYVDGVLKGTQP